MELVRDVEIKKREARIKNILNDDRLSLSQRKSLEGYNKHLLRKGVSIETRMGYMKDVALLGRETKKPYKKITKKDIDDLIVAKLENGYDYSVGNIKRKGKYSPKTINQLKISIGEFMKSIGRDDLQESVKVSRANGHFKLPEDILTKEEILKMVSSTDNFRDKALIFSLYESGCRKGEWMNIRLKNIDLDKYGAVVVVSGKTGYRRVRLIDSVPDLTNWLNQHPNKDDPNSPLWVNLRAYKDRPMGFNGLLKIILNASKRAGIRKKINPHLFRHSRLTHLAGSGFTEAELRIIAGWSASSKMPRVYIHLSGADVDRKMLEKAGVLEQKTRQKDSTKPIECVRCGYVNSATSKYCAKCSLVLTQQEALKVKDVEGKLQTFVTELLKKVPRRDVEEIMEGLN